MLQVISLYNITNPNHGFFLNDKVSIYECLPNESYKNYAIILQDGYDLSIIKKFTEMCYSKNNIEVFILADLEYYKVQVSSSEIKFKKVCLR